MNLTNLFILSFCLGKPQRLLRQSRVLIQELCVFRHEDWWKYAVYGKSKSLREHKKLSFLEIKKKKYFKSNLLLHPAWNCWCTALKVCSSLLSWHVGNLMRSLTELGQGAAKHKEANSFRVGKSEVTGEHLGLNDSRILIAASETKVMLKSLDWRGGGDGHTRIFLED